MKEKTFELEELKNKELLTRAETAFYLNVCLSVLDRLDLPKYKFRRNVRYKKSDIDTWLETNKKGAENAEY